MIDEDIFDAREELKRVDHLIFVSLKYTRTCDVMRSIIERLISSYDFVFLALLNRLKKDKAIKDIPRFPAERCNAVRKGYDAKEIHDAIDFYLKLRRYNLCKEFTRIQEFRRNVTMILDIEEEPNQITIDIVTEFYKDTMRFFDFIYRAYFRAETEEQDP